MSPMYPSCSSAFSFYMHLFLARPFSFLLTSSVDSPGWLSGGQETKNKLSFLPISILLLFIHFRTALLCERRSQGLNIVWDKVNHGSLQIPRDTIGIPNYETSSWRCKRKDTQVTRSLYRWSVRRPAILYGCFC